jgi:hypothetical protein
MPAALLTITVVSPGAPNERFAESKNNIEQSKNIVFIFNPMGLQTFRQGVPQISRSEAMDGIGCPYILSCDTPVTHAANKRSE